MQPYGVQWWSSGACVHLTRNGVAVILIVDSVFSLAVLSDACFILHIFGRVQDISNTFELGSPLGTGGFAKVIKGKNKQTGADVAIKHISVSEYASWLVCRCLLVVHACIPPTAGACREGDEEVVYKEIKHLIMLLDVTQVVEIIEVFENDDQFYIVMEVPLHSPTLHMSFRYAYTL